MIRLLSTLILGLSLEAAAAPHAVWTAAPPADIKLGKDDVKVDFDAEGVLINSRHELAFKASEETSGRDFQKVDKGTWRLQSPDKKGRLKDHTTVEVQGNQLVVSVDPEALPIPDGQTEKSAERRIGSPVALPFGRMAASLGAVLVVLAAGFVYIKKRGSRTAFFKSFLGNEKFKRGPLIETVARHSLGPKRQIVVVRVGGEYLLVGCSGDNMTLLTRVDEQAVAEENDLLEENIQTRQQAATA